MDVLYTEQLVTFAAGSSTSAEVDLRNQELVAMITSSTFTTADMTFTDSHISSGTKLGVLDSASNAVNLTGLVANKKYLLSYLGTEGLEYVVLNSSTPQVTASTIRLILKARA